MSIVADPFFILNEEEIPNIKNICLLKEDFINYLKKEFIKTFNKLTKCNEEERAFFLCNEVYNTNYSLFLYFYENEMFLYSSQVPTEMLKKYFSLTHISYWNNADKPKYVSKSEWEFRKNLVDKILAKEPIKIILSAKDNESELFCNLIHLKEFMNELN